MGKAVGAKLSKEQDCSLQLQDHQNMTNQNFKSRVNR